MALANYYLCDRCDAKTFYTGEEDPFDWAGVGDIGALCEKCAKTHRLVVEPRENFNAEG